VKIGVGVGIPLGILWLLSLAFILIKHYRKNKARRAKPCGTEVTCCDVKPVPEQSGTGVYSLKPELDPSAMLVELEATAVENGAGIYVSKPELEGTEASTKCGAVGVFVKKKWELDSATSGPRG
jgi:hypothetical protein